MRILPLLNDQIIINPDEIKIPEKEELAIFIENQYQRHNVKTKYFLLGLNRAFV